MDVRKALIEAAKIYKERVVFIYEDKESSFLELKEKSLKLANALLNLGIKKGDSVAIYLPNCPEYIYSYLAIYCLGAVAVPLDFFLQLDEIVNMLSHCEARMIISTKEARFDIQDLTERISTLKDILLIEENFWDLVKESSPELREQGLKEEDYSSIFYTSGVTGKPKGVLWNRRHLNLGIDCVNHFLKMDSHFRAIAAVPFSHSAGPLFPMGAIKYGMSFVIMKRFSPLEFARLVERYKVTICWLVPPMYLAILNLKELEKYDLSSIRWADVFGAPSNPEIIKKFKKYFPNGYMLNGWGMTETAPPTVVSDPDDVKPVGKVGPYAEIKIFDPCDKEVAIGQIGEVVIRGEAVCVGYYKEPELNSEVMRNGWFHTGDLGKFDKQGNLYIVGKIKDMIKVAGEIVFSPEIEEVLLNHPCVAEAAVIGVEDRLRGEVPKAFVVLKEGINIPEKHLIYFCKEHIAHFKIPRYIEFRSFLPKTGPQKIDKARLKKEEIERRKK
ncbi:MAG: AMP-binding protein [Candidatus Omnitrophica bacterium]|nr:AMP-binding protein [Candidatus Omnitrophota bacterium]